MEELGEREKKIHIRILETLILKEGCFKRFGSINLDFIPLKLSLINKYNLNLNVVQFFESQLPNFF
ncbi:hypothetical protein EDEG_02312 [Edhazardia aedis USNM 41457]|uniref:Uncharacterized protein n=1 Tax=Edhazardia aedis (strain USNM 41457) TaxID=1003232 RepID=J9DL83_EDHAE|nr:hypothetical protein EDEG_02312 [Edhazardia aedis USNM 41457]|eukprot:EJW03355.1 hypothetical protein EDEG_02312 [Edhazardia aedis USNM 41457]